MAEGNVELDTGATGAGERAACDEIPKQTTTGDESDTDGDGRGEQAGQQHGSSRKKKKASLEEQLAEMKEKKLHLKAERLELNKDMKAAQRKRRRLKKRANMLSPDDLFELCRMKTLNPEAMEEDMANSSTAKGSGKGSGD